MPAIVNEIKINDYEYKVGDTYFAKIDKDGDVEIVIENSSEYYGGDVRRWININDLEKIVAWLKDQRGN